MKNIIDDLNYRGLIKDYSNEDELRKLLSSPQTIYCGFDPSAASMHIGNFVMILLLMRLQKAGHRVLAVVGGGTGMIGDPSGKSKERNLLDLKQLENNTKSVRDQLARFINLEDETKGLLVNNYEWLNQITLLEYLRDYGKYFPINYLLNKEIIKSRMDVGISYTEFSYNILQAIDFLKLYQMYGCRIQIGGSDQWGNLTSGLELIRKVEGHETLVGVMTSHLIVNSEGQKFGKSEAGAIYLDENLTSPYQMYQYFINVSDVDAARYLKVFTFLSKEEIEEVTKKHQEDLSQRFAQKKLAFEITRLIHSQEKAQEAEETSEALFKQEFQKMNEKQLQEVLGHLEVEIDEKTILEDALIKVGAAKSKREAREFLSNGSILLNGEKVYDSALVLEKKDAYYHQYFVLRRGKKNYYLIKIV
ncbi:MAG: tyrosine--tRNA ligase [Bacilli bacterium]|nr:tyrosine--tRNA ligase [Bacilli bacterium]NLN80694.1 tyrosine--tRNA ligase [Erysipelotrichia bacterium]